MTNKFCAFLSNGYTLNVVDNQLTQRPCCIYPVYTPFNQTELVKKQLEYNSSAETWLPECKECQRVESSGVRSMRTLSKERIIGDFAPGECVSLQLNFDKKCNAACLSCSPLHSSTWEKYGRKFKIHQEITSVDPDLMFQEFLNTHPMDKLQFLHIQGGEPFFSDTNRIILEQILRVHPAPHNVALQYQTNGSIFPGLDIIDHWKRFKTVVINFSIDDIADRFHYLRWPLDWAELNQNVQAFITTTNANFQVNSTINPLNVLNYNNLESWIVNTIPADRLLSYRTGACLGDLDLRHTPRALRQAVLNKYGPDHRISKLFNTQELFDYQSMLRYVEIHDNFRRLDWRETFPESVPYFTNSLN